MADVRTLMLIASLAVLTACGGGEAPTPPVPAPTPVPASAPPACIPKAQVKVQLFGDSTMVGSVAGVYIGDVAGKLQADLDARFGVGATTVELRAVGGTTAADLLAGRDGLNAPWPGSVDGDVVVENHGINDMLYLKDLAGYTANLERLAGRVTLFQTPVRSTEAWWNDAYAQAMRDVAAEHHIPVAEVHEYFRGRQELLSDGVHPTVEGYALLVRDVLAPAVAEQVKALRCMEVSHG